MVESKLSHIGKELRLQKILKEDGRAIIIPMEGLVPNWDNLCEKIVAGGVDAVMPRYGIIKQNYRTLLAEKIPFVASFPTPDPRYVALALNVGADMYKTAWFVEMDKAQAQLNREVSALGAECDRLGIPFLCEIVPVTMTKKGREYNRDPELIKQAVRLGSGVGADIMKTTYTGSIDTFKEVVETSDIPVTILGGPKMDSDREVLQVIKDMIAAGGAGICFGRNTTRHSNPTGICKAYRKIIHENASVDEALKELQ